MWSRYLFNFHQTSSHCYINVDIFDIYCRPIGVVSGKEETRRAMWIPNKLLHDYYQEFPEDKSVCCSVLETILLCFN